MFSGSPPVVLGIGELLWDVFADSRRPGGAPANVAFHACQMGCAGVVASRVGRDGLGDELIAFLDKQGLSTRHIQRDSQRPTGTVTVDTSRADHPSYVIHEGVAWDYLAFDAALGKLLGTVQALAFGTLAQRSAVARATIGRVLGEVNGNCLVVYDVNLRQLYYDWPTIEASLRRANVVKFNADEAVVLGGLLDVPTHDLTVVGRAIQDRYDVDAVCITRGADGCLLIDRAETADEPGKKVHVVDAVGAGDAFTAALITARLAGWPPRVQASFANQVGGLVASRPGAMPLLRAEFAAMMARLTA